MRPRRMLLLDLLSCLLVAFAVAAGGNLAASAAGAAGSSSSAAAVPQLPGSSAATGSGSGAGSVSSGPQAPGGTPGGSAPLTPTAGDDLPPGFVIPQGRDANIEVMEDAEIDYSTCGKEAVCGVRASCLQKFDGTDVDTSTVDDFPAGKTTLVFLKKGDTRGWKVEEDCSVGMWIKQIHKEIWIVKMQVRTSAKCISDGDPAYTLPKDCDDKIQRIDPVKGMMLNHTGRTQFGCRPDENNTIIALGDGVELYRFEQSRLQPEDCYCSFLIRNADKIAKLPAGKTFMEFVLTTGIYDMAASNGFENVPESMQCDVFTADASPDTNFNNFVKLGFKDLVSMKLYCTLEYDAILYAALPNQIAEPVKSVECIESGPNNWVYEIEAVDGSKKTVPKDAKFPAFCAVPVNTKCIMPVVRGQLPPEFAQNKSTGIVTITCRNNKWLINGNQYFEGSPQCKNSLSRPNNASWIVTVDNKDVEISFAECKEDIDCKISTKYTEKCPPEHENKCAKLLKGDGLRCPIEHTLTAVQLDGEKYQMEKIECNLKKGVWFEYGNTTRELDRMANFYCEPDKVKKESQVDAKTLTAISYGAIGVVIFVLFVFAVKEIVSRVRT